MNNIKRKPGLPKGQTNNPNGRPIGSKNKIKNPVREKVKDFVEENFDTLISEIEELDLRERVRAKLELIKLVVPKPVNEEETAPGRSYESELIKRLFNKTEN